MKDCRFQDIELTARRLLEDVLPQLPDLGGVREVREEFWVREDNAFSRVSRDRLVYNRGTTLTALTHSRRWPDFEGAIRSNEVLGPVVGAYVGPSLGYFRVDPTEIIVGLMPKDDDIASPRTSLEFDEDVLADGFRRLARFMDVTEFEYELCTPIEGYVDGTPLPLDAENSIETLGVQSLTRLLATGAIAGDMPSGRLFRDRPDLRSGLYRRVMVPKEIRARLPVPGDPSPLGGFDDDDDRLMSALSLSLGGRVRVGAVLRRYTFGWPIGLETVSWTGWSAHMLNLPRERPQGGVVSENVRGQIHETWRLLGDRELVSPIAMPLRRLKFAKGRAASEDRMLDLGIAMESLFLPKDNDQADLSMRIAINAAFMLGVSADDRVAIFDLARKAYRARCIIAHGANFWAWSEEEKIDVGELERGTEQLVRDGLLHAIQNGLPTDWDQMVLG